jgi:Tn7-like transposition protein D/TniQ
VTDVVEYFPDIYPGEALYSVVTRYHIHSGNISMKHSWDELFGHGHVSPTFDLPNRLSDLAERLPPERGLDAVEIARRLTMINYYTRYLPRSIAEKACASQLTKDKSLLFRLGILSGIVRRPEYLQFCLSCRDEMLAQHGVCWWRLDHNLPGVIVCPKHAEVLRRSSAPQLGLNRYAWCLATPRSCSSIAEPLIAEPSPEIRSLLHDIAVRSARLLTSSPQHDSFEEITNDVRARLGARGFMWNKSWVSIEKLQKAFSDFLTSLSVLTASAFVASSSPNVWLLRLVRGNRRSKHPLQHILLDCFLDREPEVASRFGAGPWRCPNPLGGHGDELTIASVVETRRNGHEIGTFQCPCGLAYVVPQYSSERRRRLDGNFDRRGYQPYVIEYGPFLATTLKNLVLDGVTPHEAALSLGLHMKVAALTQNHLKLCSMAELERKHGRSLEPAPKRSDSRGSRPGRGKGSKVGGRTVDWQQRDESLVGAIRAEALAILKEVPPARVTVQGLQRRTSTSLSINAKAGKLPKVAKLLSSVVETTEQFRMRRIRSAIGERLRNGQALVAWAIVKELGLDWRWRHTVAEILEEEASKA